MNLPQTARKPPHKPATHEPHAYDAALRMMRG
jgi:hypothetical protein